MRLVPHNKGSDPHNEGLIPHTIDVWGKQNRSNAAPIPWCNRSIETNKVKKKRYLIRQDKTIHLMKITRFDGGFCLFFCCKNSRFNNILI